MIKVTGRVVYRRPDWLRLPGKGNGILQEVTLGYGLDFPSIIDLPWILLAMGLVFRREMRIREGTPCLEPCFVLPEIDVRVLDSGTGNIELSPLRTRLSALFRQGVDVSDPVFWNLGFMNTSV